MAQEDGSHVTSDKYGLKELNSEDRGLCMIQLLIECAHHVASGSIEHANIRFELISELASTSGDTMQRMVAYFTEALADRMMKAFPGVHKALNSTNILPVAEEIHIKRLFSDHFPFLKLSYLITNQAIIEAMEGEKMVHIVDLHSFEPAQWINLIQTLNARPESPPQLRITGIHEEREVLDQMASRLIEEAEKYDIPFQFNPIVSKLENLDVKSLRAKTGEALAICSALQLHSLLATADEDMSRRKSMLSRRKSMLTTNNLHKFLRIDQLTLGEWLEKDRISAYNQSLESSLSPPSLDASPKKAKLEIFLTALLRLSPKIMVITEQEANHNCHTLMERVMEAMNYYAALFDCLESTLLRASPERQKVEKMLYGEEIKNIISCEGIDRKERHEKLESWILRLELSGFMRVQLSNQGRLQATKMLRDYGYNGYEIKEDNGCVIICWNGRPLFSVSAWRFHNYE